jgi:hypothetical protein
MGGPVLLEACIAHRRAIYKEYSPRVRSNFQAIAHVLKEEEPTV